MQKNYLVKKVKVFFDGSTEYQGLSESSSIKDAEALVDIPTYGRIFQVKSGVSKLEPLTFKFLISKGSNIPNFINNWKNNNEYHDVTIVETDATGTEIEKTSLRDCECHSIERSAYNAATPEAYSYTVIINCTTVPVRREA